jgi:putative spermidine/putrescine transport system substrate-binding protein
MALSAALCSAVLTAGCTSGAGATPHGADRRPARQVNWATVTSVAAGGGMRALIAAAKREGRLNVIGLSPLSANYAAIIRDFHARYGITVHDADPHGASKDELSAVSGLHSPRAPDVLDLSTQYAIKASRLGLLARYRVAEWDDIPATEKAADGTWYASYGGYMAIGYDARTVKVPPTSFSDLLKPVYKHQVALIGDPASSGAALSAVYAAALASGGSLGNIEPGISYFARLRKEGNFVTAPASLATVRDGHTPIVISWDYLLAARIAGKVPGFRIVIPADATYAAYRDQAIPREAPDPAAARLWEEFLYSAAGQNLWLAAKVRPAELPTMLAEGTAGAGAHALPPVPPAPPRFPSPAELGKAMALVARQWAAKVVRNYAAKVGRHRAKGTRRRAKGAR